jgi:hypothetical protein
MATDPTFGAAPGTAGSFALHRRRKNTSIHVFRERHRNVELQTRTAAEN